MDEQARKRHRENTGGSYASKLNVDVSTMSDSQKLDFLIQQSNATASLAENVRALTYQLRNAYQAIEHLQTKVTVLEDRASRAEMRALDSEARQRRGNLIFNNIPETDSDSNDACRATLTSFLANQIKLTDDEISGIVFQRVHRLGKKRTGVAPNGDQWRPRPLIAEFRDFEKRELVLGRAKLLKGSNFSIHQDYPSEIRKARGALWNDYKDAKAAQKRASIVYPAKLIVDSVVVRDMFPKWGNWDVKVSLPIPDVTNRAPHQSQPPQFPRSGSPMHINMADLVNTQEFSPRSQPVTGNPDSSEAGSFARSFTIADIMAAHPDAAQQSVASPLTAQPLTSLYSLPVFPPPILNSVPENPSANANNV